MSAFTNQINNFSNRYRLDFWDQLKLKMHYPLFKAFFYLNYSTGFMKSLAEIVFPFFDEYTIYIKLYNPQGQIVNLPICFESASLASFEEVFLGNEYGGVPGMEQVRSILDIGANTGMASIYFLANSNLEKLVAVEANPGLANELEHKIPQASVAIENLAIYGEVSEGLKFRIAENHRDSQIVESNESGENIIVVKSIQLDELLKRHQLDSVDVLKMDIEGSEHNIMQHCADSFKKFHHIFMEIHGPITQRNEFKQKLISLGFEEARAGAIEHPNCETGLFTNKLFR